MPSPAGPGLAKDRIVRASIALSLLLSLPAAPAGELINANSLGSASFTASFGRSRQRLRPGTSSAAAW